MGTIWVKEFTGGLDTRRLPVTTTAGVLIKANNGHINRGGEFEKRAAFVPWRTAAGTVGMAAGNDGVYVFGHTARPDTLHASVKYQRLEHPDDDDIELSRILCAELHSAKLYVVAEFEDNSRHMFYDGEFVGSWSDSRARATFTVKQTRVEPSVRGSGSIRIVPGSATPSGQISSLRVGSLNLISSAVVHPGTTSGHGTWVSDIIAAVNANTGTTGFSASNATGGWIIDIQGPAGTAYNQETIDCVLTGTLTVDSSGRITGGRGAGYPTLQLLWIGDTTLVSSQVLWSTGADQMAMDIAAAINALTGTSGFSATTKKNKVIVRCEAPGEAYNGEVFAYILNNDLTFLDVTSMRGGTSYSLPRGTTLKTADDKVYAVSGKALYFSGIAAPTEWTTDNVGAGFIDMGSKTKGGERLTALSRYQNYLALFAERTIIIEYIDPDPVLNRVVQVLRNTGTRFPNSVTEFGDSDVFYADASGLRSVQARASTNAAATTDTGVPVDGLVSDKLSGITNAEAFKVVGLIEPRTGNFWLSTKDVIYVFAFYPGAKISAWTTYTPSYYDAEAEEDVAFEIEYAGVYDRNVFVRSGDQIFAYGGAGDSAIQYDATLVEAWLPYMDANAPSKQKDWQTVDLAVDGEWTVHCAMSPQNEDAVDSTATVTDTTYEDGRIPLGGRSNHLSLRVSTRDAKAAKLSSLVVTYDGGADENS